MNFVWTHLKKNDALFVIKKLVKLIFIRYEQIVRFIRIDDEQILNIEYDNFMKLRRIITKRIVSYTLIQNDKIERFEKMLTMRSRALRIQTILSCELWSKFYKTVDYLNNRISKKSLNWLIFIEVLTDERSKLSHFQSYDCRVYSLKHIIVRKMKMKSRVMIDHLIKYDSINVFRIWISSKMRVIRTRNVLFDFYSFYDFCVLDLKHFLSNRMKDVIQILKILETTFDDVLIEQNDDDFEELIFETSFKKIDELMIDLIDLQISMKISVRVDLQIDLKIFVFQLIILEIISNREIHSSTTFATSKFDHIVTLSILKVIDQIVIQIDSNASQRSQSVSISDVQVRFESTSESTNRQVRLESFDRTRLESSNFISSSRAESSSDFVAMNTRSRTRRQTYATTLIIVDQLDSYFATFSIDLQRLDITSAVLKLHRDDLSIESRYWRQMLSHRFSQEFQSAAIKKMTELKKRETFLLIEKRSNQIQISLIWVFKYKFDIDDYVEKFKTRLCFKDDLQMTHQDTYAIILAARTFRALMTIATAFDLDIWQYDAVSAFINNSIDEKIYNECLDDFIKSDFCWKLQKALYDLKQISILWYRNLINVLEDLRLMSILEINCLYANDWLILFFYVNDIIILFMKSNANRMRIFEKALMQRFEMRILDSLQWFLSIRITRDREKRKIWLCQNSYIIKMTSKFNLKEIKCSKISLIDLSIRFEKDESHVTKSNSQLIYAYQQCIESLNFAAMISRFDIAFVIAKLTQFLQISHSNHFSAADRMISYLYEIKNLVIEYSNKRSTNILLCVNDATFADDETIRKSFDDYLFQLYDDSIDWRIVK
jgi:hypothetical protein